MKLHVYIEGLTDEGRGICFRLMRDERREERLTLDELDALASVLQDNRAVLREMAPGNQVCLEVPSKD